jgi:hypothetical protein
VPDVTSKLRSDGALIIEPMPSTDHVVRLAECLVQIVAPRVGVSSDLHDGKVYSIMVRNQGRGTTDEYGHVIYSTTNAAFSLHVDGYNCTDPPRVQTMAYPSSGSTKPRSLAGQARTAPHFPRLRRRRGG